MFHSRETSNATTIVAMQFCDTWVIDCSDPAQRMYAQSVLLPEFCRLMHDMNKHRVPIYHDCGARGYAARVPSTTGRKRANRDSEAAATTSASSASLNQSRTLTRQRFYAIVDAPKMTGSKGDVLAPLPAWTMGMLLDEAPPPPEVSRTLRQRQWRVMQEISHTPRTAIVLCFERQPARVFVVDNRFAALLICEAHTEATLAHRIYAPPQIEMQFTLNMLHTAGTFMTAKETAAWMMPHYITNRMLSLPVLRRLTFWPSSGVSTSVDVDRLTSTASANAVASVIKPAAPQRYAVTLFGAALAGKVKDATLESGDAFSEFGVESIGGSCGESSGMGGASAATSSADGSEDTFAEGQLTDQQHLATRIGADNRRTVTLDNEFADRLLAPGAENRLAERAGRVIACARQIMYEIADQTCGDNWTQVDLFYLFQLAAALYADDDNSRISRIERDAPPSVIADHMSTSLLAQLPMHFGSYIQRLLELRYAFMIDKVRRKNNALRIAGMLSFAMHYSPIEYHDTKEHVTDTNYGMLLAAMQTRGTMAQRRHELAIEPCLVDHDDAQFVDFMRKAVLVADEQHYELIRQRMGAWVGVPLNDEALMSRDNKLFSRSDGEKELRPDVDPDEILARRAIAKTGMMRHERVTPQSILTSVLNAAPWARDGVDFLVVWSPLSFLSSSDPRYYNAAKSFKSGSDDQHFADDGKFTEKRRDENNDREEGDEEEEDDDDEDDDDDDDEQEDGIDADRVMEERRKRRRVARQYYAGRADDDDYNPAVRQKKVIWRKNGKRSASLRGDALRKKRAGRPSEYEREQTSLPLAKPMIYVTMTSRVWNAVCAQRYTAVLLQRARHWMMPVPARRNFAVALTAPLVADLLARSTDIDILCGALNAVSALIGASACEWHATSPYTQLYAVRAARLVLRYLVFVGCDDRRQAVNECLRPLAQRATVAAHWRAQMNVQRRTGGVEYRETRKRLAVDSDDVYAVLAVLLNGAAREIWISDIDAEVLQLALAGTDKTQRHFQAQLDERCVVEQPGYREEPEWYAAMMKRILKPSSAHSRRSRRLRDKLGVEKYDSLTTQERRAQYEGELDSDDMTDDIDSNEEADMPSRAAIAAETAAADREEKELYARARLLTRTSDDAQRQSRCVCGGANTDECITLMRGICDLADAQRQNPELPSVPIQCCICALDTLPIPKRPNPRTRFLAGVCRWCLQRTTWRSIGGRDRFILQQSYMPIARPVLSVDETSIFDVVEQLLAYAEQASDDAKRRNAIHSALKSMRFRLRKWSSLAPVLRSSANWTVPAATLPRITTQPLKERISQIGNCWMRRVLHETYTLQESSRSVPPSTIEDPESTIGTDIAAGAMFFGALEILSLTRHSDVWPLYGSGDEEFSPPGNLQLCMDYFAPLVNCGTVMRYCDVMRNQVGTFPLCSSALAESTAHSGISLQTLASEGVLPLHIRLQNMLYNGQMPRPLTTAVPLLQELLTQRWYRPSSGNIGDGGDASARGKSCAPGGTDAVVVDGKGDEKKKEEDDEEESESETIWTGAPK